MKEAEAKVEGNEGLGESVLRCRPQADVKEMFSKTRDVKVGGVISQR